MCEEIELLTQKEISFVESSFKYSCILYYSDALRFKFDITQFKANVLYNIQFLDLMPLYNEYYYKYNREFLNLYKKEFYLIKSVGFEDTFILLLTNNDKAYQRLCDLSRVKSYKYKANFTKAERSLLYKLRHSVSYRCLDKDYLSDMEIQMEYLEDVIEDKELLIKEKGEKAHDLRFNKRLFIQSQRNEFELLCSDISELQNEVIELKEKLSKLERKYNSLKYGGEDEKTLLDDYSW